MNEGQGILLIAVMLLQLAGAAGLILLLVWTRRRLRSLPASDGRDLRRGFYWLLWGAGAGHAPIVVLGAVIPVYGLAIAVFALLNYLAVVAMGTVVLAIIALVSRRNTRTEVNSQEAANVVDR